MRTAFNCQVVPDSVVSMSQILISVVIPAYNYGHLLPRAVSSVLSQMQRDTELLVINDGSTDDTSAVLEHLQTESMGVFRFLETTNSGLAATRNLGIEETSGDYLVFLDADDELAEHGLDIFREAIQKHPEAGMVVAGHMAVQPSGKQSYHGVPSIPQSPRDKLSMYLVEKSLGLANGAVAMNRTIFSVCRYNPAFRSSEDLPVFACALANFQAVSVDKPVMVLHKHNDSLRHDVVLAKQVGVSLVDEVFDPGRIPETAMVLKSRFAVQRYLSLSRTCFLSGDFSGCRSFYKKALSADWRVLFRFSYTRKAFMALFR